MGKGNVKGIRGLKRRGFGNVESPHVLAGSFRTNKNGCWVSGGKNGQCGGGKETRTRGLKEGRDGKERVR